MSLKSLLDKEKEKNKPIDTVGSRAGVDAFGNVINAQQESASYQQQKQVQTQQKRQQILASAKPSNFGVRGQQILSEKAKDPEFRKAQAYSMMEQAFATKPMQAVSGVVLSPASRLAEAFPSVTKAVRPDIYKNLEIFKKETGMDFSEFAEQSASKGLAGTVGSLISYATPWKWAGTLASAKKASDTMSKGFETNDNKLIQQGLMNMFGAGVEAYLLQGGAHGLSAGSEKLVGTGIKKIAPKLAAYEGMAGKITRYAGRTLAEAPTGAAFTGAGYTARTEQPTFSGFGQSLVEGAKAGMLIKGVTGAVTPKKMSSVLPEGKYTMDRFMKNRAKTTEENVISPEEIVRNSRANELIDRIAESTDKEQIKMDLESLVNETPEFSEFRPIIDDMVEVMAKEKMPPEALLNGLAFMKLGAKTSRFDFLTGLQNRRGFYEKGLQDTPIVRFDLDKFKLVNDQHGHAVGDKVIQKVSGLIKKEYGDVFRVGGEEIDAVAGKLTEAEVRTKNANIRKAIAADPELNKIIVKLPKEDGGGTRKIGFSSGYGLPDVEGRPAELLADTSLYEAKKTRDIDIWNEKVYTEHGAKYEPLEAKTEGVATGKMATVPKTEERVSGAGVRVGGRVEDTGTDKTGAGVQEGTKTSEQIDSKIAKKLYERINKDERSVDFQEVFGVDKTTHEKSFKAAADLISTDFGKARKILRGEESLPGNMEPGEFIELMARAATDLKDPVLQGELIQYSKGTTKIAQALESLKVIEPNNPAVKLASAESTLESKYEKKYGKKVAQAKESKAGTYKKVMDKALEKIDVKSIDDFIKNITC